MMQRRTHDHARRRGLPLPLLLLLLQALATPAVGAMFGGSGSSGGKPAVPRALQLSLKRLLKEYKDVMASGLVLMNGNDSLSNNTEHIRLAPCRGNLHEWHFTIAGPPGSVYAGGIYHGRVLLPGNYPQSAPRVQMLNPSGRFEVGADICLSATAFHQETWQPVWTVRTLVSALRSHMTTKAVEVGGMECTARRRLVLAQRSRAFQCRGCGVDHSKFPGSIFTDLPDVEMPAAGATSKARSRRRREAEEAGLAALTTTPPPSLLAAFAQKLPLLCTILFLAAFFLLNAFVV